MEGLWDENVAKVDEIKRPAAKFRVRVCLQGCGWHTEHG